MNIHAKSRALATEIGKPERQPFIERQLLAKAFEANRAAIDAANGQAKTRAHIDGTAYTHQRILRRETIEAALRYRAARVLGHRDMMRAHAMALRSLNRVRREMRDAYPSAKPFWESGL